MKVSTYSFACLFCISMACSSCAHSNETHNTDHSAVQAQWPDSNRHYADANAQYVPRPDNNRIIAEANAQETPAFQANVTPPEGKRVTITDQALNMPMGTVNLPAGWKLHQDVASNPQGGGYLKFHLAAESPQGEIYGYLPPYINYLSVNTIFAQGQGLDFEGLMSYLLEYSSAPYLEKIVPGSMMPDQETMALPEIKQFQQQHHTMVMQTNHYAGIQAQPDFGAYKVDFRASRKQIPYKGTISSIKMGSVDQSPDFQMKSGTVMGSFVFAPENLYEAAVNRGDVLQIQLSPQWNQRRSQIIDRETQQMTQNHQQRMQQQQQQFQSHQQHMASMQQGFEQQNKDWYNRNFSSYNGNAAVNDAITGHTSFNDPYTGHQIKQEGHYNYWYTNEFGEYKGSNDPNFQPGNHYNGNWQPIQPLKPGN